MTEINNKIESKTKFYSDNTPLLKPLIPSNQVLPNDTPYSWNNSSSFVNLQKYERSIDRSDVSSKKEERNTSSILLDRQFAPAIFNKFTDLESDLIKPTDCTASQRINYKIDNVNGYSSMSGNYSLLNEQPKSDLDDAYGLLISDNEHQELSKKLKQTCGQKKKTLDYSDYQAPPRKSEGIGFGNPENYQETYLGLDTRAYVDQNAREIDITNRTMTPPDALRINYSNLPYEWETREGVTTRTFKKMITNFQ